MKKITLFLAALALSLSAFAQTSIVNINSTEHVAFLGALTPANTLTQNTEYTINVTIDGTLLEGDVVIVRMIDRNNGWGPIAAMGTGSTTLTASHITAGNVDVSFTPLIVHQPATGQMGSLQSYAQRSGVTEGGFHYHHDVNVQADPTLSSDTFATADLEGAYYNGAGSIVIANAVSYSIYNLAGVAVAEGTAAGSIDVAGLASGVYILSTDAGILKFVK